MIAAKQRLEKKRTSRITLLRVYTQECGSLSTRVSLKRIWLLPSDVLTTFAFFPLDNSLSVLLKLNKQLKISSNNLPRTNQGISDLNTRNMEIFRLELEGIWQFGILEAQNSDFFNFFFYDQQLTFENNGIRFSK
jgi:hypothetical protein